MDLLNTFTAAYIVLFVVVDPLGVAGLFAALTNRLDDTTSRKIAFQASFIAIGLLTVFSFVGLWLLTTLHISLPAFRIAGGLLLFITAFRMIMGYHDPDQLESEETAYKDKTSIAVFPLAIPLLAGPGTMTAALLLISESALISGKATIIAAIIAVELTALIIMLASTRVTKILGMTGNSLLARVMGVLMAAMAVQFVADGIFGLIQLAPIN